MKTQTTAQTVEVRADGEGLVSHAGAFLLVELADRLELTGALSEAMAPTRERRSAHDPGVVLRDLAVSIADGGDCLTDLGALRGQEALFGVVASESTAHRVIKSIDANLIEAIRSARAKALVEHLPRGIEEEKVEPEAHAEGVDAGEAGDQQPRPRLLALQEGEPEQARPRADGDRDLQPQHGPARQAA